MSKSNTGRLIAVYFTGVWLAAMLRIDFFPLTWAPMFASAEAFDQGTIAIDTRDRQRLKRDGWWVTQRDGSRRSLTHKELNIRTGHMATLYFARSFDLPEYRFEPNVIERWLERRDEESRWKRALMTSLNKTLELEPDDDEFIVKIEAEGEDHIYDTTSFERLRIEPRRAALEWEPSWSEDS